MNTTFMKHATTPSSHQPTVRLKSTFWKHYQELIAQEVLPYQWAVMSDETGVSMADDPGGNNEFGREKSHVLANLRIAAGLETGEHYGFPFQDTDLYKWIEAAAYIMRQREEPQLRRLVDSAIDLIAKAQCSDGYLDSFIQITAPTRRFARLRESHELYTMGHFIEAAVACHESTGYDKALNVAIRMADCIDRAFGPEDGKIHGSDGHPEIELALSRLYEVTGEQRYIDLARYLLDVRGQDPDFYDRQDKADGSKPFIPGMSQFPKSYYQAAEPIREQKHADGHAVRVGYLCTGLANVARLTGDAELADVARRLWDDIIRKRMYITGNVGSTRVGESFTYDYDLPNETMYGESCASVSMAFFARSMMNLQPAGLYGDIVEKELFNGALAGMSLDGKHFFYVNPLEADPQASAIDGNPDRHHVLCQRADWFGCACCPSNIARLIASVEDYIYTTKLSHNGDILTIYSSQFIANSASFEDGIAVDQRSDFPWNGHIEYSISVPAAATSVDFAIRIPQWSQSEASAVVSVDGSVIDATPGIDGFVHVSVASGATVHIECDVDMRVKLMEASTRVRHDIGKVAVMRGPIVFCAEEADNQGPLWLHRISVDSWAKMLETNKVDEHYDEDLLDGVEVISMPDQMRTLSSTEDDLYQPVSNDTDSETSFADSRLTLIPYYSWANRGRGRMQVWFDSNR
ncbi:MAG: beta-L-arabinofuranosidase domain-containing protein [Bifidobacterium aquikefiri]|uniref:Glycosyhydrolase n=1 Tax=Bifidobacterium aquikefiri TaxID=1653207 RepID=A0A261G169_9BIFI|nr:beta-L-arabinofuranosidase domain-containing protein [Bifidobacterium aquikefiri]OZG65172.1 hypothetical protein BAQU_1912 [Bifidobacterium aquikefiri]